MRFIGRRNHRYDVAIHELFSGPLYKGGGDGWSGGAELQAYRLAYALAERGLRVAQIVLDEPGLPSRVDGVDLITQQGSRRGPRGMRRLPSYWSALHRADASVYVQRCAGFATGAVGTFARLRGRAFVYSVSSDVDLYQGPLTPRDAAIKDIGLRLAHRVVTQTRSQQSIAAAMFGAKATLIRSFSEPVSLVRTPEAFLWIGGLIEYKNPLACLDLAALVPDAQFVMVGTPRAGSEGLAAEVSARAEALPNVRLTGPCPRRELFSLYGRAVALLNTSEFEGFPNTFLEAWACGVPVLALNVDPDGVIAQHGLGAVAGGSPERLVELAQSFWLRRAHPSGGCAAKDYIRREHHSPLITDQWIKLVSELM